MSDVVDSRQKCGQCRTVLDESPSVPEEERQPCPACGSLARDIELDLEDSVDVSDTIAELRVDRVMDGLRLTTFGVLVTVGLSVGVPLGLGADGLLLGLLVGLGSGAFAVALVVFLFRWRPARNRIAEWVDRAAGRY